MYSILSFDIISVVLPDPKIFLCIPASADDAAAVNPKGIKTRLANGLTTFFVNGNPVFINGPRSLPRFATCLFVNNNLYGKLVSTSTIIFDDNLKTTSVSFLIAAFNFLSYESHSFTRFILYW